MWRGFEAQRKKKSYRRSVIFSDEPIPLGNHGSVFFLQAKVATSQTIETFLQATALGLHSEILKSKNDIALLESSNPGCQPRHFRHRRPSIRSDVGVISQKEQGLFLGKVFFFLMRRGVSDLSWIFAVKKFFYEGVTLI